MSSLKEQNGKYYQQCKVVMLATNYGKLTLYDYKNLKTLSYALGNHKGSTNLIPQHLYILSNDEIKEGDWVYDTITNTIQKAMYSHEILKRDFKKIIATTDTLIIANMSDSNAVREIDFDIEVPKPSDSFIKKYIEEYNAGRQITNVLVEYVKHPIEDYWYLHTDSDYEITITKLKDSYSRQEVIKLLNSAMIAAGNHGKRIQTYYMTDIGNPPLTPEAFTNQWIEDNL